MKLYPVTQPNSHPVTKLKASSTILGNNSIVFWRAVSSPTVSPTSTSQPITVTQRVPHLAPDTASSPHTHPASLLPQTLTHSYTRLHRPELQAPHALCAPEGGGFLTVSACRAQTQVTTRSATTERTSEGNQRWTKYQSSFQKQPRGCGKCSSRPQKPGCREGAPETQRRRRSRGASWEVEPALECASADGWPVGEGEPGGSCWRWAGWWLWYPVGIAEQGGGNQDWEKRGKKTEPGLREGRGGKRGGKQEPRQGKELGARAGNAEAGVSSAWHTQAFCLCSFLCLVLCVCVCVWNVCYSV